MGSFAQICEIVEAKEELPADIYRSVSEFTVGDRDIDKLFAAISAKNFSKGSCYSPQPGSSPMRKNPMKKPMSIPQSPRFGISESVSLKQALRELSISKASELASVKRASNFTSPRISEAGRIKNLYNTVINDKSRPSLDEGNRGLVEKPLGPEKNLSKSSEKVSQFLQEHRMNSLKQNAQSCAISTAQNASGTSLMQNDIVSSSVKLHVSKILTCTTSQYGIGTTESGSGTTPVHNDKVSASAHLPMPVSEISDQSVSSSFQSAVVSATNDSGMSLIQNFVSTPKYAGTATVNTEQAKQENHTPMSCHTGVNTLEPHKRVPVAIKLSNRSCAPKLGRRGRLHKVPSSFSTNGVSKLTKGAQRVAKPTFKNKNLVKKKRHDPPSLECSSNTYEDVNSESGFSTRELLCQRCQCVLKDASKESNHDSLSSQSASLGTEVSLVNCNSGKSKPSSISNGFNDGKPEVANVEKHFKSSEKGEVSQSSKSSIGEYSSSTSISDESYASGFTCGSRPHMSKDARWEAIRHIQIQHRFLGLSHFNLIKKLGCGDIGTVYLAELIGTSCLFAIKVMDNEFLARRDKMPRAETEREILRILDHPFLPTLYAQFTSDNLSCLVMEYCPGGDLHVLRQKQHGRSFPEQSARFYVAEVLLALEYLHMLGVVYRDLKPENILVREDGHIMLTDFDLSLRCTVNPTLLQSSSCNTDPARLSGPMTESSCIGVCIEPSCQVPCFSPRFVPTAAKTRKIKADRASQMRSLPLLVAEPTDARSNSFVGTHEYLAPEIIKGEGHGAAVDWWTLGVFLFELLYGKTPFRGCGNEETLANVVLQSLKFPHSPLISFQARDLIQGLLIKEPENRLGSEKGAAEIKQHPFFAGLNWALIRCAIPPELSESYDFGALTTASQDKNSKYLECKATGEKLEFEMF